MRTLFLLLVGLAALALGAADEDATKSKKRSPAFKGHPKMTPPDLRPKLDITANGMVHEAKADVKKAWPLLVGEGAQVRLERLGRNGMRGM